MNNERRFKIAVLGSASDSEYSESGEKAQRIGRAVAAYRGVLLTGGCPGLPHAAAMGASAAGGLTVAVSPAMDRTGHVTEYLYPQDSDVIMYTGMGRKGRNVILVRSADAGIFVSGGMGTLNEFTIAVDELGPDCAIGVLAGSGGLSDEFPDLVARVGKPTRALLIVDGNPETLVQKLFAHLRRR
ncbi:MAG: hypothetical protein RDU20_21745 [Desulfomonilaceae bacterium]|nr:hypothetical protein [Desulfomonilaceae bacterium]